MTDTDPRHKQALLLASVFVVAVAGLVYELVAGTLSTYLLGSSVTVFSVVIGLFLSAMGLGAYIAKFVTERLVRAFVVAELLLGLVGGLSALALFQAYSMLGTGYVVALGLSCVLCGALVGIEIPLLIRILEDRVDLRVAVSHVLALDYLGALVASIAFPLLLLPHLGLVRSCALFGLLNVGVAVIALRVFKIEGRRTLYAASVAVGLLLLLVGVGGGKATTWIEDRLYVDPVLVAHSTPYQRIVVTRYRDDIRLYLDGHLQLSSNDEYRYHEALVHPPMSAVDNPARVLVLGGGDGMAVREVLRHPQVKQVDLVDLDPKVVELFRDRPMLNELNAGALADERVTVHYGDAIKFLEQAEQRWDVILMDLPDPNDAGLSRLYSIGVFQLARQRLMEGGALATQATSPFYAPDAFWCIERTVSEAMTGEPAPLVVRPYHVHVPSFGEWGFVMASSQAPSAPELPMRYLNPEAFDAAFLFGGDMQRRDVEVNRLSTAVLARYYRQGWQAHRGG